jgi:hypothetical protein
MATWKPLAALAGAAALALTAGDATGSSSVYVSFRLPSGNIGCGFAKFAGETANLRCEIISRLRPLPPKQRSCTDGVWGRAVGMAPTGRAAASPARRGRPGGLTCRNRSGHGWFLSRAKSRIF